MKNNYQNNINKAYTALADEISTTKSSDKGCSCKSYSKNKDDAEYAKGLGYSQDDLELAKFLDIKLCLGCGNPVDVIDLKKGEICVDLGSGGGFDCFKASKIVGNTGKVIGIDSNEKMIELSKKKAELAKAIDINNVEFLKGDLENIPLLDNFANAIWSNCVFNLASDKQKAINEVFRILKPNGRFIFSDVIALDEITNDLKKNMEMQTYCISRATPANELKYMLESAGFKNIKIEEKNSEDYIERWTKGTEFEKEAKNKIKSAYICAFKG